MYVLASVTTDGSSPDTDYLPVLARGSKFVSQAGQVFSLIDDIDFANPDNEIVVATTSQTDGSATAFAVKAMGRVISGELELELYNVGSFTRFLTVPLSDPDITEIVSVTDSEGHEYFEVDYLSQDTVFRSVINKDASTRKYVPSIMVTTAVPRRFTTFKRDQQIFIKFGYGSESSLKTDNTTHPSNVVLKMHGRDYETDLTLDPSKLLETDKFGIAPANTTLNIVYRTNKTDDVNVASRALNGVSSPLFVFGENATNESKISFARDSLEIVNEEPITGDVSTPTTTELKQRINDVFASQNRAVTAGDYEALIYRMPSRFGRIKRAKIIRDHDSFKRNLNLYLLSEDEDSNFIESSQVLKNNVKVWLNQYKMINDTLDILDPRIVNIRVNFTAVIDYSQDKFESLNVALTEIEDIFREKLDIGQPIYITKIYDRLNNLEEIVDVTNVEITNQSGGEYSDNSLNLKQYISADGRILYAPENVVYELKFPDLDIKGTVK